MMSEVVKKLKTEDGEVITKGTNNGSTTSVNFDADRQKAEVTGGAAEAEDMTERLHGLEEVRVAATDQETSVLLKETDVGITEYISSHQGFSGVIKQRFSDFLVNEISLDGSVVHLTDTAVPACDMETPQEAKPEDQCLSAVLTEAQVEQLRKIVSERDHKAHVVIDAGDDKAHRSRIHQAIRELFPALESKTEAGTSGPDSKVIKVTLPDRKNCKDKRMIRRYWPAERGDYCHFVLYKENKDTIEAVNVLSKLTRMRAGSFNYAGTKDKRAKTSQMISIHRVSASRLQNLNRTLKGMKVGNFKYCSVPLKLGDHKGNKFTIILRNVTGSRDQIEQAVQSLATVGFINYYGMQRFGTTTVPTHHVGRALLRSQWDEAIDLIMKPRENDHPSVLEARATWQRSHDPQAALEKLGQRVCIERQLLQGLARSSANDRVNALANVPRNTRHLYLHAYQSYVWNVVASSRIKEFGLKPIVGDLVIPKDAQDSEVTEGDKPRLQSPVLVTTDNLPCYEMTDVVLPLPGYDIMLPDNPQLRQIYTDILAADCLTMDDLKHKVRDYALAGDYRHILIRPEGMSHEVLRYNDVTKALTLSDLDKLRGHTQVTSEPEGKFVALKVEFSLPSSTYATMAIREILKLDTSAAHQTTLNVT